jgi:hypothetical protein
MFNETLKIYDQLVDLCPDFERKGKTVPYTSANGYMFSLINKDGELGFRFSKEDQQEFIEKHNTTIFKSHGAVMRGYVLIPREMFEDLELLSKYLNESYAYVISLPKK